MEIILVGEQQQKILTDILTFEENSLIFFFLLLKYIACF